MICFMATWAWGQQTSEVISKESDGSYVVRIRDGATTRAYRALSEDQLRALRLQQNEMEALSRDRALLQAEVDKLRALNQNCELREQLRAKTAELDAGIVRNLEEQAQKWKLLYEGEHALRLKTEGLVGRGRVTSFFDNPFVQIGFKALVPTVNLLLTSRKN
jgi:hypothetical protein